MARGGQGRSDNDGLCQLARRHTRARKFNASATATKYRRCRGSIARGHYAEKASLYASPEQRTPEQAKALAVSDTLIDELFAAETIVLAVPMHNFAPPSTFKAWIDHVVRAGRTFFYGANGPQGLLKGKHAIVVLASGGVYTNEQLKPFDFTEPYLRTVLGFIGITDVDVVRVEGVANSAIGPEKALASARTQSKHVLAQPHKQQQTTQTTDRKK